MCVLAPYLDPNITVGSQGRVIQTSRGSFTNRPLEGCCRPQDDVPAKFQQRYDGAEGTITVDQRPIPQNSDFQRKSDEKQQQVVEHSRHLYIAALKKINKSKSRSKLLFFFTY